MAESFIKRLLLGAALGDQAGPVVALRSRLEGEQADRTLRSREQARAEQSANLQNEATSFGLDQARQKAADQDTTLGYLGDIVGGTPFRDVLARASAENPHLVPGIIKGLSDMRGKPASGKTKMFREGKDYVTRMVNPDGTPGREVARSKITGLTEFDLAAGEPTGAERTSASRSARESATTIQDIASVMRQTQTSPGAFGVRGAIGEAVGGMAQQVNPALGEAVTRGITGGGTQDIASARTDQRKLVARLLPQIANDTSGRYSDQDVKRAQEIAGSGWEKSPEQVRGALSSMLQIEVQTYYRNLSVSGVPPEFDLSTKDGINQMGDHLMQDLGMDYQTAVETVQNVRRTYQYLYRTGVKP